MNWLTGLALSRRSVVLLLTALIVLVGAFGITRLQSELIPNLDIPVLTVITSYPGASPEVVDSQVGSPIDNAVRSLPDIDTVQTTSSNNTSVVVANFNYGTDMAAQEQQLTQLLNGLQLPAGASRPNIQRISLDQFPVVQLSLTGANGDLATLRQVAEQRYLPALSAVDGVSRVDVTGGSTDGVVIALDPAKLNSARITADQVAQVLQANNVSTAAGAVQTNGQTFPVRVGSQINSLDALKALPVGATPGANGATSAPITLGDIADVSITPTGSSGVARTNGEPSISISVYMNQGANTVDTARGVRSALKKVNGDIAGSGQQIASTTVLDQSTYIQDSINSLEREALLGAGFAILVIFVFLLSVRSTLVTAISIPLSMLVAFIVLWTQGISLNIMTLGALAVAVGRVIDDAIVVLESIYRHVQSGDDPVVATREGTREVALAITASTLTTVAVFLPLGFVGGLIGELFRPFALTVTFALLASLLVALTVVPVLASYLIRKDKLRPLSEKDSVLQRAYVPVLRRSLAHPVITLGLVGLLFVGSLGLAPFIGTSFISTGGEKIVTVQADMPSGTSRDVTLQRAEALEQVIRSNADVVLLQTQVGGDSLEAAFNGAANDRATITAKLDNSANLSATESTLREKLAAVAGNASISVSDQSGGFGGGGNSVQVIVKGSDYTAVSGAARALTSQIAKVSNLVNVSNDVVDATPEIDVQVDPSKAAAIGSTPNQISAQVRSALSGVQAGQVTFNNVSYPVSVTTKGAATDLNALRQLPIGTTTPTSLSSVATVSQGTGPAQVVRIDGDRAATITGTITTDETGNVSSAVSKIIRNYKAPAGVNVTLGGVTQQQNDAFANMGLALLIAIALVYLVMVASFGSLTTPFVILFALPLAVIGVLVALFITGKTLGLPALIGVLMLVGIVVTNAIVLLELVLDLQRRGLSVTEALIEGGKTRLRPILMTAMATILALLPLALTNSGGVIIAADLAVVVIGGLFTSTFLTLIVVPVLFELIAGRGERKLLRAERAKAKATIELV
ncbi:MAG TPA: efflux RND transporter permease subunit, partial [Nitrolancea sp.]|nr:efflux RND transporter permease subunit [Nitrolancea sp.]